MTIPAAEPLRGKSTMWAVVAVLVAMGLGYLLVKTGPTTQPEEEVRAPKVVQAIEILPENHRIGVAAYGTVVAARRVMVESQVNGYVVDHHPSLVPGGFVSAGDTLFAVDSTLTEISLREARASVSRADAALKEAERKRTEGERLANDRVIPETELASLESSVRMQQAELDRLKATVDRTEEMLIRHQVVAPFNAMVLEESIDIGQRVDGGYDAATLVGTDEFWVRASVPMDKLRWIERPRDGQAGAAADVYLETGDGAGEHRPGRVTQLMGDVERQGRMARVLISVEDPLGLKSTGPVTPLLLGSYVRVVIDAGELQDVLAINRTALREGDRIWLVNEAGKLQIRDVRVRWREAETVYVDNVLRPGETLVVSDLRVALPNMDVQVERADKPET